MRYNQTILQIEHCFLAQAVVYLSNATMQDIGYNGKDHDLDEDVI